MPNATVGASYNQNVFVHRYGPFTGEKDGKATLIRDEGAVRTCVNLTADKSALLVRHGTVDNGDELNGEINGVGTSGSSICLAEAGNVWIRQQ